MVVPNIVTPLATFLQTLRKRVAPVLSGALDALQHSAADTSAMTLEELSCFLSQAGVLLNKTELENVMIHFGDGSLADASAFLRALEVEEATGGTFIGASSVESPNKSHLALSGVMSVDFTQQYKPFPAHWGQPPNASMKGYDGIVRDLDGGYGKGNAPMAKWVKANIEADGMSQREPNGASPYPYGGYSYGCTASP